MKIKTRSSIKKVNRLSKLSEIVVCKKDIHNVVLLSFLVLFGALINVLNPYLYGMLIDSLENKLFGSTCFIILFYIICNIVSLLFSFTESYLGVMLLEKSSVTFKKKMYTNVILMKCKEYNTYLPGELVSRLDSDAEECLSYYYNTITNSIVTFIYLLVPLVMITRISFVFAIITMIIVPFLSVINYKYGKSMQVIGQSQKQFKDKYSSFTYETIRNIFSIKLFRLESKVQEKFSQFMNERVSLTQKTLSSGIKANLYSEITSLVLFLTILLLGIKHVNNELISVGSLIMLLLYSGKIKDACSKMLIILSNRLEIEVPLQRIKQLLDAEKDVISDFSIPIIKNIDSLMIRNLSFSYSDKTILKNVNLNLNQNGLYAITGANGSGKTTFLRILAGLYDYNGAIVASDINNNSIPLNNETASDWRKMVLMLEKTVLAVCGSISENIDLINSNGKSSSNQLIYEDFYSYATTKMPDKIDNDGRNLSSGQKQILNMLRACRSDAPLLLIDEITSDMDEYTKKKALDALIALSKTKIILFVTHDKKVLETCTTQYIIEDRELKMYKEEQ